MERAAERGSGDPSRVPSLVLSPNHRRTRQTHPVLCQVSAIRHELGEGSMGLGSWAGGGQCRAVFPTAPHFSLLYPHACPQPGFSCLCPGGSLRHAAAQHAESCRGRKQDEVEKQTPLYFCKKSPLCKASGSLCLFKRSQAMGEGGDRLLYHLRVSAMGWRNLVSFPGSPWREG